MHPKRDGAAVDSHQPEAPAGSDSYGAEVPAGQDAALESEDAFKRPTVQRRQIERTVSPATKAVPPPSVGQRFQSAQAMESFFSAWGRAQKVWLIGTQHTLSATYTCEACCERAKEQPTADKPADICRAHVAARSNGKWVVDALNLEHCCATELAAALSVPKRSPPKRRKIRRIVESFPEADMDHEQQQQQQAAVVTAHRTTTLSPLQHETALDSELAVPTSAAQSSPMSTRSTTGNRVPAAPSASTTQATQTPTASSASAEPISDSNATSLAHPVASPPPPPPTTASTWTTTPRITKIGGFLVTKPTFSEQFATKARDAAEATLLQDEIAAFLFSLDTAQDAEACSRAAMHLASAGVKTAGDLAMLGYLEPATRQAFVRALRLQGADNAALDALSYVISKEAECFHHA